MKERLSTVQLLLTERWILANQCRILEALYPKETDFFKEAREALEQGYELEYERFSQHIHRAEETMTTEECDIVNEVLDMFHCLQQSYNSLLDKSGIDPEQLIFEGFDGNNETKEMMYARYICKSEGGKYTDLNRGRGNFNSHSRSLPRYHRMLMEWKQTNKNDLTKDEIIRITSV